MKILLVSQMYPNSGQPSLGVFVQRLETQLAQRGHEIKRVVLRRHHETRVKNVLACFALGVRAWTVSWWFKPDVMYVHFLGPGAILPGLCRRRPIVVTCHGQDVDNIGTWRALGASKLARQEHVSFIAVSDFLKAKLEQKLPALLDRVTVVNCGVDLEVFTAASFPNTPTVFLCVGALSKRKNVLALAEAFERVRRDGESLVFVGPGDEAVKHRLQRLPCVTVIGAVHPDEVADHVARAHVVCQPSTTEPFGLGALEGMARGRSVVGTKIGGHGEFIPPAAGVLVNPVDGAALADALRRVADESLFPRPNPVARAAAELHDIREKARIIETVLSRAVGDQQ